MERTADLAIFDLDGTLVNTLGDLADAVNAALSACGYPSHPEDAYRSFVGNGRRRLLERALPESSRNEEEIVRVGELYDAYYHEHALDRSSPYDGIPQALDMLMEKGVKLAVLSNKPHEFTQHIVSELLGNRFAVVLGQREGVPVKPDPTAVREILALCGVRPERAVYIGDSDVDALTGKAAGLDVIGCAWGFRGADELRRAGARWVIDRPCELVDIIAKKAE